MHTNLKIVLLTFAATPFLISCNGNGEATQGKKLPRLMTIGEIVATNSNFPTIRNFSGDVREAPTYSWKNESNSDFCIFFDLDLDFLYIVYTNSEFLAQYSLSRFSVYCDSTDTFRKQENTYVFSPEKENFTWTCVMNDGVFTSFKCEGTTFEVCNGTYSAED